MSSSSPPDRKDQRAAGPQTNIGGAVHGVVLSGEFHGPVYIGGNVHHNEVPSRHREPDTPRGVDVVILTVLPEEYEAVCGKLSDLTRWPGASDRPNLYAWQSGRIPCASQDGAYVVVVGQTSRPGTNQGALATDEALQLWRPRYIFFVGIAGGLARARLGDVVIADVIHGYEYGKIERQFQPRSNWTYRTDLGLLTGSSACAPSPVWRELIQVTPPCGCQTPVLVGEVASGDKVVDNPNNAFFRQVLRVYPKAVAVEMEGAGAGQAIEQAQARGQTVGLMMVRGISDVPRAERPGSKVRGTRERDKWNRYAAEAAAAFTVGYITAGLPVPPRQETVIPRPTRELGTDKEVAPETAGYLAQVAFLTLFPEGVLRPIFDCLVTKMNAEEAVAWAKTDNVIRVISSRSGNLIGLAPEQTGRLLLQTTDKGTTAAGLLEHLLHECFAEDDPFVCVVELGFGSALLLRDLLNMAELARGSPLVAEVCALAQQNLHYVINEEYYDIALAILETLERLTPLSAPADQILKARLMGRTGRAQQATQLFDLYRGDNLFADTGLDERARLESALDWARAVKEAGVAGTHHQELVGAYSRMLKLLDLIGHQNGDEPSLATLRGDILNNQGTQLAVYGPDSAWPEAEQCFLAARKIYAELCNAPREVGTAANYVAHYLDRFEHEAPLETLLATLEDLEAVVTQMAEGEEKFFYYYQKGRVLKRLYPWQPLLAKEYYELAYQVARGGGLPTKWPIAKRWVDKLLKEAGEISESAYLEALYGCLEELKPYGQDAWAVNVRCVGLIEAAQLFRAQGQLERAWAMLVERFKVGVARYARSGSQHHVKQIRETLQEMDRLGYQDERGAFLQTHQPTLNWLMQTPVSRMPTWAQIRLWLQKKEY